MWWIFSCPNFRSISIPYLEDWLAHFKSCTRNIHVPGTRELALGTTFNCQAKAVCKLWHKLRRQRGRVVRVPDLKSVGRGFKSRSDCYPLFLPDSAIVGIPCCIQRRHPEKWREGQLSPLVLQSCMQALPSQGSLLYNATTCNISFLATKNSG